MLASFLFFVSILSIGSALVSYFKLSHKLSFMALAFGLGSAIITCQLFLYFVILRLHFSNFIFYLIGLESLAALIFIFKKVNWSKKFILANKKINWLNFILSLVIVVLLTFNFLQAISKPIMAFDGVGFWSMRAKALLVDGYVNFDKHSENFLASFSSSNYPWHFSLLEYWFRLLGGSGGYLNLISWGYFVSLVLLIIKSVSQWLNKWQAYVLALFFISMPLVFYHAYNNYADITLAYYATLGFLAFLTWLKAEQTKWLMLAGWASGWAIFVKNEGIFYALALVTALVLDKCFKFFNLSWKKLVYAVLFVILPILPWLIIKAFFKLGFSNTEGPWGWHPEIFNKLAESLFISNNWNIWWIIFIFLTIILFRKIVKNKVLLAAWLMFIIISAGIIGIYALTEHYQWALDNTALSRTLIPLAPISILLLAISLSSVKFKDHV